MGLRFDLSAANWLAHVLDEKSRIPPFRPDDPWAKREIISALGFSQKDFFSSPERESEFDHLLQSLERTDREDTIGFEKGLLGLRRFFAERRWTALIVPSGSDEDLDGKLCSPDFLRGLVRIRPDDPGLILQLTDPPARGQIMGLQDVFPAFRTALMDSTSWPGVLLWTQRGEGVFLPFWTRSLGTVRERAHWMFSHLSTTTGLDPKLFKHQYLRSIGMSDDDNQRLTILQMSDIHLGCPQANQALPRLQQLARNIVRESGGGSAVLPIVSGDLIDDPDEDYHDQFRAFHDMLRNLANHPPILLLGNHDVRRDGYKARCLEQAVQIPAQSKVYWIDEFNLGIAAFNSVLGGRLARGSIGQRQFYDIGSELDAKKNSDRYTLIGVLHHHPISVEKPEWYAQPFYERILGPWFERTDELEDAEVFLQFAKSRSFATIMHGHKHIPRLDKTRDGIPVFGCGSSVGKVDTKNRIPLMSLNVLTFDRRTNQVAGSLLVESVPGGGLGDYHTLMCRWTMDPNKRSARA
jgi:predicted MPP superfamily phosphohydrolase